MELPVESPAQVLCYGNGNYNSNDRDKCACADTKPASLLLCRGGLCSLTRGIGVESPVEPPLSFALLFAIMIFASAKVFFLASSACRVLAATSLPTATPLGFFAGLEAGVGFVACCVISTHGSERALPYNPFGCSVDIV